MTHQVNLYLFFLSNNDELCRIFDDDVVHFDYFKNEYFNQSTLYDIYDQVNDSFRLAQIVPPCEYYDLHDMNKVRISSSTSINMLSFNISSILRHLEQFLAEINSLTFGNMGFCKTHLTSSAAPLYKIPIYDMFARSRSANGGGVVLYAKRKCKTTLIDDISVTKNCI